MGDIYIEIIIAFEKIGYYLTDGLQLLWTGPFISIRGQEMFTNYK
jgi:hypothetical protein